MEHEVIASARIVLVTGASSGFGKACAIHLGKNGYRVYGTSRSATFDPEAGKVRPDNHLFTMIPMDVRNDASVNDGVSYILEKEGRIDIVINNAGIAIAGAIEEISIDELQNQFETNFFGAFRVCRAALPQMRAQKSGYIINISSIGGLMGIPFQGAYSATKFALEGLSESLRIEVKPFGIHVVLIEPGDFKTGFTDSRIIANGSHDHSAYADQFKIVLPIMENEERNGADPHLLALLVEKIINHPNPKVRYTTGKMEQRFSTLYKRLVPSKMFEKAFMKYYKLR
jgi:NAD(P)-dependent dehydrogenase (short-subunit alcohol dehydrogenase family)